MTNNNIPDVYVQFQIPLTEIGGIGQAIYTNDNYGVKGIIIYHEGFNNYLAFDRACSYAPDESCEKVEIDDLLSPSFYWIAAADQPFLNDGTPTGGQPLYLLNNTTLLLTEVIYISVIKLKQP